MNNTVDGTFAVFEGQLDLDRVQRLFADRSLLERAWHVSAWASAGLFVFGVSRLQVRGEAFLETIAVLVSLGIFLFGLLQQWSVWHVRRWKKWNECLLGDYRVELREDTVLFLTSSVGCEFPYSSFKAVDSGRSAIRLALDATYCRVLLLPISDVDRDRAVSEVVGFLKQQISGMHHKTLAFVSTKSEAQPLAAESMPDRICFRGPVNLLNVVNALDEAGCKKQRRLQGLLVIVFVFGVANILISTAIDGVELRNLLTPESVLKLGCGGLFVVGFLVGMFRRKTQLEEIATDPTPEDAMIEGWVSREAMLVASSETVCSVRLGACESHVSDEEMVRVTFWRGDFLIFNRQMFESDVDFLQARGFVEDALNCNQAGLLNDV